MRKLMWSSMIALMLGACGKDATSNNTGNNADNGNNAANMSNGMNASNGMNSQNAQTNNNVGPNNSNNAGTNNVTTPPLGPPTAENWTQHLIRAYCEATFDCPGSDFYLYDGLRYYLNTFGSKEACLAAAAELVELFGDAELQEAFDSGRLVFDESVAPGCLDAYAASACDQEFDPAACDGLYTPQVADADNCAYSDECSNPESVCAPIMGTCFGACGLPTCGGQVCAAGEFCDANDTCTALKQPGEACLGGECVDGATCNYVLADAMGTCTTNGTVPSGGYCWLSDVCVADHFCDFADDTCKPYAQAGEACTFGDCVDPLLCNVDFDTMMGICVAAASVPQGGACAESALCVAGLYCDVDTDTCEPANKALGEDCVFSVECASGICNYVTAGGTCAEANTVAEGGACGLDEVCMDGLSCDIFDTETCRGLGDVGDPCNDGRVTFFPVACAPGLACLNVDEATGEGTCGALLGDGAACQDFTQCAAPLTCIGLTCQARLADGAACEGGLECASFACDETSLQCEPVAACMVP